MRKTTILVALVLTCAGVVTAQVPDEVRSLVRQGIAKHDRKDYDGAIEIYKQALALSPNDPIAHFELALSLHAAKRLDDALDQIMVALIRPGAEQAMLHDLAGTILDTQGRFQAGEAEFRKALELKPDSPHILFNLAVCLMKQGKWSEASDWLKRNLERRPNHATSWSGLAFASLDSGQRVQAILSFWRLAALAPESSEAVGYTDRAWKLLMKGVTREGKGNVNVELGVFSGADDDPRAVENVMLSLTAATRYIEKHEKQTDSEFFVTALESLAEFGSGAADAASPGAESTVAAPLGSFWQRHLYAYFEALQEQDFTRAMVYSVRAPLGESGVAKWLEKNSRKVEAWKRWQSTWVPASMPNETSTPVEQAQEPEETPDGSAQR